MNNTIIIIPTYNASDSIVTSIKQIRAVVPEAKILIVDDNSPDGTSELVNSTFLKDKNVILLTRKSKGGRGSAVIAGFKEALKDKSLQFFIEMDADLCHNPKYITKLVAKGKKYDVVIASKYLRGSTIKNLALKRIVMSRLMNMGARLILQVPISDFTNGFRCYTRRAVEYLSRQKFKSKGFVVLSETVYLCHKKGFSITEIPFDFIQVSSGATNLNLDEIKEALYTLLRLRFNK